MKRSVCVAGGGASGMMAAIAAARAGADVTILEKNDRPGKKILMTGNGKCNLTNLDMGIFAYYIEDGASTVGRILEQFDEKALIELFKELGMDVTVARDSYVYPKTQTASTVLNVLRRALKEFGVSCKTDTKVTNIKKESSGFSIETDKGAFFADRVIISMGGKSFPKTGSDGDGFLLAKKLGLSMQPDYPALTALICPVEGQRMISGLRADGEVSLLIDGKKVFQDSGQIQFTDYGISGIPVFQVSRFASALLWNRKKGEKARHRIEAAVNLFPGMAEDELFLKIEGQLKRFSGMTYEEAMTGLLHKKWIEFFGKRLGLFSYPDAGSIPQKTVKELASELVKLSFPVEGVKGYDFCQVTGGGVDLSCVDEHLQAKAYPGLFLTGELLDVTGKCGGYNLQWAFSTGYIAGTCAAE